MTRQRQINQLQSTVNDSQGAVNDRQTEINERSRISLLPSTFWWFIVAVAGGVAMIVSIFFSIKSELALTNQKMDTVITGMNRIEENTSGYEVRIGIVENVQKQVVGYIESHLLVHIIR